MTSQYILTPFNLAGALLHTPATFFACRRSAIACYKKPPILFEYLPKKVYNSTHNLRYNQWVIEKVAARLCFLW